MPLLQLISYLFYVVAIVLIIDSLGFENYGYISRVYGSFGRFRPRTSGFLPRPGSRLYHILGAHRYGWRYCRNSRIIGQVQHVGLRTTSLRTREDIVIIVPNTKLTTDNVINWSQNNNVVTRFNIDVGVAYGSDTKLI